MSSKLTSFWRGPFNIIDKVSDINYKIDCGQNGSVQVIHCDRMKKYTDQGMVEGHDIDASPLIPELLENEIEPVHEICEKQTRRKPVWCTDYVLFLFSTQKMPLTKTTTQLPPAICPSCEETIEGQNFRYHILNCVGKQHGCDVCRKTFKKKAYLL